MKLIGGEKPINSTAGKVIQKGFHFDEEKEKEFAMKNFGFCEILDDRLLRPKQYFTKGQNKIIGHKFGRMTVIAPIWKIRNSSKDEKCGLGYMCRCSCGNYERRRKKQIFRKGNIFIDMCFLCRKKCEIERSKRE